MGWEHGQPQEIIMSTLRAVRFESNPGRNYLEILPEIFMNSDNVILTLVKLDHIPAVSAVYTWFLEFKWIGIVFRQSPQWRWVVE